MEIKIIKKDGTIVDYDEQKIINACSKSASRALEVLSNEDYASICNRVLSIIEEEDFEDGVVTVKEMHSIVEKTLMELFPKIGENYRQYRNYKNDFVMMLDDVYTESQKIMYLGDKDNANTDSALVTTKRVLIFNKLNRELYRKFFMNKEELQACNDGYIYVHDQSARRDTMNCCIADIETILTGGFEMANIWYNEPKTLDVAFDVIGDIVLSMASCQYGGFTIPEVDKLIRPYAEKSYAKYIDEYFDFQYIKEEDDGMHHKAHEYAMSKITKEMEQGYQGWEYKFNTVASSRGDYPFISITFGLGTDRFEKLFSKSVLKVRREGQGKKGFKKPVLFPKLIFLYTKDLHGVGMVNEDLFEEGIITSSKTMYPDWLSLDGDNTLGHMYQKYKKVISPMGKCKSAHVKLPQTICLMGVM